MTCKFEITFAHIRYYSDTIFHIQNRKGSLSKPLLFVKHMYKNVNTESIFFFFYMTAPTEKILLLCWTINTQHGCLTLPHLI